jgi:hypothetical protein
MGFFLGLNGIDFFGFLGLKSLVRDKKNYDTNGCTDFTDFIDSYGFFWKNAGF